MCFGTKNEGHVHWVTESKIHLHLETQKVTLFGNRVFADVIY